MPPEQRLGPRRVRVAARHVAGTSRHEGPGDPAPAGALERAHDLEHRPAAAHAQVERRRAGGRTEVANRGDVPFGEVLHVQVVAHARPILGRPVAAEDRQLADLAPRDLAQERHEVLRPVGGRFADAGRGMRARRVEVAQDRDAPVRVGAREVAQEILGGPLGAPVDALRLEGGVLRDRQRVRLTVDRRRAREHESRDARLAHHLGERDRAGDVDVPVRERTLLAFADRLEPGAMHDAGDRMVVERPAERLGVAHVRLDHVDRLAAELGDPRHDVARAVGEVVEDERRVAGLRERAYDVRADVARSARDEDLAVHGAESYTTGARSPRNSAPENAKAGRMARPSVPSAPRRVTRPSRPCRPRQPRTRPDGRPARRTPSARCRPGGSRT